MTQKKKKRPRDEKPLTMDEIDRLISVNESNYSTLQELKRRSKLIGFRTPNDNR